MASYTLSTRVTKTRVDGAHVAVRPLFLVS